METKWGEREVEGGEEVGYRGGGHPLKCQRGRIERREGGKLVLGEEKVECVPPHQNCWGGVGWKG